MIGEDRWEQTRAGEVSTRKAKILRMVRQIGTGKDRNGRLTADEHR